MAIKESGEMYLETILILSQKNGKVRSVDIAESMGFSKPSVSRAVAALKAQNYITVDAGGIITLSKSGYKVAAKIYERHTVLTRFIESLGVDSEPAAADACKIEHDISDTTFNAMKNKIK